MSKLSVIHSTTPRSPAKPLDRDLRGYLDTNSDVVLRITKPVNIEHIGALSAQSEQPIVFENIVEHPGYAAAATGSTVTVDQAGAHRKIHARGQAHGGGDETQLPPFGEMLDQTFLGGHQS